MRKTKKLQPNKVKVKKRWEKEKEKKMTRGNDERELENLPIVTWAWFDSYTDTNMNPLKQATCRHPPTYTYIFIYKYMHIYVHMYVCVSVCTTKRTFGKKKKK